jgi:GntR family transcriptional repressor for pyruvate dehydrogenase complex
MSRGARMTGTLVQSSTEGVAVSARLPAVLASQTVSHIRRLSAVDTVRARIMLALELGLLQPGEKLPTDVAIASTLGVSGITARRAIESLAEEGVVVRRRGRTGGTFVTSARPQTPGTPAADAVAAFRADRDEVHRLIDVRVLLETAVTHHAALRSTPAELAELQAHVDRAAAAQTWADYHEADEAFHRGVARASGLDWAMPHYDAVLSDLYAYFLPYPVSYLHRANEEHARLVDALRAHDPVEAVEIIVAHISVLHRSMFVGLEEQQSPRP